MTELQYLRDLFTASVLILSALGAALVGLLVWVYLSGERRIKERLDTQDAGRIADKQELNAKLEEQDTTMASIKAALVDESRVVRDFMHKINLRVSRLEWGRRKSDHISDDESDA